MKILLIAIFVFICSVNIFAASDSTKQIKIAVADFEGHGIAATDASSLAERFTAELSSTGKFFVIEHSRMTEIFKQAAFEQTWCNDPSCAKAIGKLVAVDKMVLGSVSKVGGIFTVNIRLTNVETGAVEKNFSEDCDCGIEELLTGTLRRIARKMAGISGIGEGAIVTLQKGDAGVFVKSFPDSAKVVFDGHIIEGMTPLTIQGLPSGRHDIRVQKGNLAASNIVTLKSGAIKKMSFRLKPQETVLKVLTNPSEAEVYINSHPSKSKWPDATTPAVYEGVKTDNLKLTIFSQGYLDTTISVSIAKNKENMISIDLKSGDATLTALQNRLMKQRSNRRLGFRLSIASLLLAAGGGACEYLAQKDYSVALDDKKYLDQASITDARYYAKVKENKDKTDAGNQKAYIGYGLFGVAAIGMTFGLVLYF